MAKGYWVAQVDVSAPEAYRAYVAANQAPFRKYGARFLVRAGQHQAVEGRYRSRLLPLARIPGRDEAAAALRCRRRCGRRGLRRRSAVGWVLRSLPAP